MKLWLDTFPGCTKGATEVSMQDLQEFLVVPRTRDAVAPLLEFMKVAREQYAESVAIDNVVGGTERPKRLVVRATEEAVRALKSRFADELDIEPNLNLTMLS